MRSSLLPGVEITELTLAGASISKLGPRPLTARSQWKRRTPRTWQSPRAQLCLPTLGRAFHILRSAQVDAELDEA